MRSSSRSTYCSKAIVEESAVEVTFNEPVTWVPVTDGVTVLLCTAFDPEEEIRFPPLLFASAVLLMTSHLSGRLHVSGLADLMKTIVITTLGLSMTAFLGVMTLQGSLASLRDGVTLKSVKFIASNLVPVVGKALSDATTSIAGGLLLVKNATGIISAVVLLLICAFPSLKILALSLVYRLAGTLLQPVGDSPVIATLSTISKTLTLLFAVTAVVGLMFFFSMIITVWITNTTAMVR